MWQPDIVTALQANATVAGLVGTRVYLAAAPGPGRPYVVLTGTGGNELQTADGPGGLPVAVVEVAAVADTYQAAQELYAAVKAVMLAPDAPYTSVVYTEPLDVPRDAPNVDGSIGIFAVVGLWEVAYR